MSGTASKTATLADYILEGARSHYVTDSASLRSHRDYIVVVHELKEEDGGGFLAIAPDLPGCVGDGDSRAAAVADVEKAMAEWIDEAVRLNREVPKPGACFAEVNAQQEKVKNLLWQPKR